MTEVMYNYQDLRDAYEKLTACATAQCTFTTPQVGGISPDEKGVDDFVKYQLKLGGEEAEATASRIKRQELPYSSNNDPNVEEGELDEKATYGVRVIRRDERGPWLGNWMIHACLKVAASRTQLFVKKRGSKGDFIEIGEVRSTLFSKGENAQRVYLVNGDGEAAPTEFKQFKGRVNLPSGSTSIVEDREVMQPGARFAFEFRYKPTKITNEEIVKVFAAAMVVGLGSSKSFGNGKFRIDELTISAGTEPAELKPKKGKESKPVNVVAEEGMPILSGAKRR